MILGEMAEAFAIWRRDAADKIVPASGETARLTLLLAGAMAFLSVFALAIGLAAAELSRNWEGALMGAATVEIGSGDSADLARAMGVLETTPGIDGAELLGPDAQAELLRPWLGADFPVESLPLPRLISVKEGAAFDREALVLRLQAEVPSARYLAPESWSALVGEASARIRLISLVFLGLVAAVMAAVISLAARAALAAQSQIVETLRMIGAQDRFVTGAFTRRFVARAVIGAGIGTGLGALCLTLFSMGEESLLRGMRPGWFGWLLILALPLLGGVIAFFTTRLTAARLLARHL